MSAHARLQEMVDIVAAGILRLRAQGVPVTKEQANERARNIVVGLMSLEYVESAVRSPKDFCD